MNLIRILNSFCVLSTNRLILVLNLCSCSQYQMNQKQSRDVRKSAKKLLTAEEQPLMTYYPDILTPQGHFRPLLDQHVAKGQRKFDGMTVFLKMIGWERKSTNFWDNSAVCFEFLFVKYYLISWTLFNFFHITWRKFWVRYVLETFSLYWVTVKALRE